MRMKDIGYGLTVIALSLTIALGVAQMGRFTSATKIISDVKPSQTTQPTQDIAYEEVLADTTVRQNVLEQVLYIGELRGCGLRDDARIPGADYFCVSDMTVFNAEEKRLSDLYFQERTLDCLLAEREYTCVVLSLGLNEAGYPVEQIRQAFEVLVDKLVRTQPQAQIVLQGILTVGYNQAARAPYTAPERLEQINDQLRQIAAAYRVGYLDVNGEFADSQGYLPDCMSADGCYLYPEYNRLWSQWLCEQVNKMER